MNKAHLLFSATLAGIALAAMQRRAHASPAAATPAPSPPARGAVPVSPNAGVKPPVVVEWNPPPEFFMRDKEGCRLLKAVHVLELLKLFQKATATTPDPNLLLTYGAGTTTVFLNVHPQPGRTNANSLVVALIDAGLHATAPMKSTNGQLVLSLMKSPDAVRKRLAEEPDEFAFF